MCKASLRMAPVLALVALSGWRQHSQNDPTEGEARVDSARVTKASTDEFLIRHGSRYPSLIPARAHQTPTLSWGEPPPGRRASRWSRRSRRAERHVRHWGVNDILRPRLDRRRRTDGNRGVERFRQARLRRALPGQGARSHRVIIQAVRAERRAARSRARIGNSGRREWSPATQSARRTGRHLRAP